MQESTSDIQIRVRYGETDQMGVVYYGNYALYLEQARTEMLRSVGFTYKNMEENDVFLPVVNLNIRYKKPAKYDDLITIKTKILGTPTKKIVFYSEMYNEANEIINECEVVLVFVNNNQKLVMCPENISVALNEFICK